MEGTPHTISGWGLNPYPLMCTLAKTSKRAYTFTMSTGEDGSVPQSAAELRAAADIEAARAREARLQAIAASAVDRAAGGGPSASSPIGAALPAPTALSFDDAIDGRPNPLDAVIIATLCDVALNGETDADRVSAARELSAARGHNAKATARAARQAGFGGQQNNFLFASPDTLTDLLKGLSRLGFTAQASEALRSAEDQDASVASSL